MSGLSRFRAMGCEVVVTGAAVEAVAAVFERYERVFSRFRPASELARVNRSPRETVTVTPLFASVLRCALDAAAETEGLVDPTLGGPLEACGYDCDYSLLGDGFRPLGPVCEGSVADVRLDGLVLRRPPGLVLDLNGVVKALAVDGTARLVDEGFVSAGGDLAVRGPVDVALPGGDAIRVLRGGLATSGTARRWLRGGAMQHHLIDPRTGRPSTSPWREVTVSGATCLAADVAAKAAFLLGHDGPVWLDARGLPGRFLADDGEIVCNESWSRATAGTFACT